MSEKTVKPKILILKQKLDVFGSWHSFEYSNTTPQKILDSFHSKTNSYEAFLLFKADHIVVDTKLSSTHLEATVKG